MAKVYIQARIEQDSESHSFEGMGMYKDHRLIYYDDQVKTVVDLQDYPKLLRETDESKIILEFSTRSKAICQLKTTPASFNMSLELLSLKQEKQCIEIQYRLEEQLFVFYLSYEVIQ